MNNKLSLTLLIIIGFLLRICGLSNNHSFWMDEEHVAIFARAIIERGKPVLENGYSTTYYQFIQYWLGAASAKLFGLTELALRFPSVIFGVLTIWAIYLFGGVVFNKKTSLLAAAITTFLTIEILWSRQARPYQALQFLYLIGAYFVYKQSLAEKLNLKLVFGFLISGIMALLFHTNGLIMIFSGIIYLIVCNFNQIKNVKLLAIILIVIVIPFLSNIKPFALNFGKFNNLFYYRVFLMQNYLPLIVFSLAGISSLFIEKKYKRISIFGIFIAAQLLLISFFLRQPFTRYFYIIFPFIILLASYGLIQIVKYVSKKLPWKFSETALMIVAIAFLGVSMKNKFVIVPQKTYSLNEDMQEIPEVDWKKTYNLVAEKLKGSPNAVLITNWNDLPIWFLGEGSLDYLVRKDSEESDPVSGAKIINSLDKFQELIESEKSGIIVIDSWDDAVPEGIREYSRDNLKKELEVDRLYEIQPRYWPVSVYSWGLD